MIQIIMNAKNCPYCGNIHWSYQYDPPDEKWVCTKCGTYWIDTSKKCICGGAHSTLPRTSINCPKCDNAKTH